MKTRIIIRTDGTTLIGMGHVVRCMALAEMLEDDFEIFFVMQETDLSVMEIVQSMATSVIILPGTEDYGKDAANFSKYVKSNDIVVLDGYHFDTDYQRMVKTKKAKLICIDDLHDWHQLADAIINYAEGLKLSDYSVEPYTRLFSGLDYILLRKVFLEAPRKERKIGSAKIFFISMGGADIHNLTPKFTDALIQSGGVEEIHLMLGSVNVNSREISELIERNKETKIISHQDIAAEEIKTLLEKCDVAICPASTISLECCATGIGLVTGVTSSNQAGILNCLKNHQAASDLGNLVSISAEELKNAIGKLRSDPEIFNLQISNQSKMIDGKSPQRIRKIFFDLLPSKLSFRFASISDVDLYFKWANDPLVRKYSYNQRPVEYSDHVKWFKANLTSDDCYFYLFQNDDNHSVGQVRINIKNEEPIIGISIDEKFRGMSLGAEMLKQACDDFHQRKPGTPIVAYIKEENKASYNIFRQAGFDEEQLVVEEGHRSYRLTNKDERGN